jgi:hypothetical protein
LPTNADSVKNALRREEAYRVARENREAINELKKLIEPQTIRMKALTDEYEMLGERRDKTENRTERHQMSVRRQQLLGEIGLIKREKIGSTRVDRTKVEDIEREIQTRERADARYSKNLPELPSDDILDADAEMAKLVGVVDEVDLREGKAAFGAEAVLRVREGDFQRQIDEAMGVSGSPRGSVQPPRGQVDKVIDEVTSGVSGSARSSTPSRRDATYDDAAGVGLPFGLPPGHRRGHLERRPPS